MLCLSRDWRLQKRKREQYLAGTHLRDFDNTSLAIANAWLDPDLEAYLGYALFDSVAEAARPYTADSRCAFHLPPHVRPHLCTEPAARG